MTRAAIVTLAVLVTGCEAQPPESPSRLGDTEGTEPFAEVLELLSFTMRERIGNGIGTHREARFLARGDRVVVFDRFPPHLRLFSRDGDLLWTGGPAGDGPRELRGPQAIAGSERIVHVWERGRISRWTLMGDSLAWELEASAPLGPALAIEHDCEGRVLVYGPWPRTSGVTGDSVGFLHRVEVSQQGRLSVTTLWSRPGGGPLMSNRIQSATALHRGPGGWVLFHEPPQFGAPEVLAFDCDGNLLGEYQVHELAALDPPSTMTIGQAVVMTSQGGLGVIRVEGGFVLSAAAGRMGDQVRARLVMRRDDGTVVRRTLAGRWALMDYDEESGLLIATRLPFPHFVPVASDHLRRLFAAEER